MCGSGYYSGSRREIFDFPAGTTPRDDSAAIGFWTLGDGRDKPGLNVKF
jgi:elongation factor P hydroxylase